MYLHFDICSRSSESVLNVRKYFFEIYSQIMASINVGSEEFFLIPWSIYACRSDTYPRYLSICLSYLKSAFFEKDFNKKISIDWQNVPWM